MSSPRLHGNSLAELIPGVVPAMVDAAVTVVQRRRYYQLKTGLVVGSSRADEGFLRRPLALYTHILFLSGRGALLLMMLIARSLSPALSLVLSFFFLSFLFFRMVPLA